MKGFVITFGRKALAIQTKNNTQYYAPLYEVEDIILANLNTSMPIYVVFDEDKTQYAGHSNGKPRYYAKNVRLQDVVYF